VNTDPAPPVGPDAIVHHIALIDDWHRARPTGWYHLSTRGATLEEIGYIHCARRHQIDGVLNRFYADLDEVVILDIDPSGLDLRYEPVVAAHGDPAEDFPHLYGPLPVSAVVAWRTRRRDRSAWIA